jgi:hypothetical protein
MGHNEVMSDDRSEEPGTTGAEAGGGRRGESGVEIVSGPGAPGEEVALTETVQEPAKVMRIGSMIKQLLEEVRSAPQDDASRVRLKEIYDHSVGELATALSPDLAEELRELAPPFDTETPSDAELRVAKAQLVGWLEGLFHGIQATLFAQQMAAQSQLAQMRQRGLPPGVEGGGPSPESRPGTYL